MVFLITVAVIAPPKSNRLLPVKVYLFLLPFISFAIMEPIHLIFPSEFPKEVLFVIEWMFAGGAFLVLLLISLFEQPVSGIRVYMKCPRNFFGRLIHFIFSSGLSGSILLTIPMMLIPAAMIPFMKFHYSERYAAYGFLCIMASILSCVILSLFLSWRTKLPLPPWLWVIILQLVGNVAAIVPAVIEEGFDTFRDGVQCLFMLISPFFAFIEIVDGPGIGSPIPNATMISFIVAGCLLLILSPVFFKAFRLHRRPADADAVKTPTPEMMKK